MLEAVGVRGGVAVLDTVALLHFGSKDAAVLDCISCCGAEDVIV